VIFFTLASLLFDGVFDRPGAGYTPKKSARSHSAAMITGLHR
jgi:hypothetical protein